MRSTEIRVRRLSVVTSAPFDTVVSTLTATVGRPDMNAFHHALTDARTAADLEGVVRDAVGPSQLMEFVRFDAGEVLRKDQGKPSPRILRILIGNPVIMKEMAKAFPTPPHTRR